MRAGASKLVRPASQLLTLLVVLTIAACGGSGGGEAPRSQVGIQTIGSAVSVGEVIPATERRVIPFEETRSYRASSAHASALVPCLFVEDLESVCKLSRLPYIGQQTSEVSIDDIMDRVMVSHDWMGARFEQMLYRMPADMLGLFQSVTMIVIGSEVRPSSFTPALGLLQLDPYYLWLSNAEKRTISTDDDPRTDFGSGLRFIGLSRTMIGGQPASYYWPLESDVERRHEHIEIDLARLLYHELAHANDFVPTQFLRYMPLNITPYDAVQDLEEYHVADLLVEDPALTTPDPFFDQLADVRFRNVEPTTEQASATASFVGARMQTAGKMGFYSYVSPQEDVATLFEAAMMKYHYDIDTHVAFANKPSNRDTAKCDDYKVAWGVRNRLAAPLVLPRAEFVVQKILQPSGNVVSFMSNYSEPVVPLRQGDGWCESGEISSAITRSLAYTHSGEFKWYLQPGYR